MKKYFIALLLLVNQSLFAEQKPNILFILADDLGYNDLSIQGSNQIKTPHIDRILSGGVRFTNGYVSNAVCAPSRAGLLTGRMGSVFGFESNLNHSLASLPGSTVGLPLDQKTIADYLNPAGYKNICIGKWHLGDNIELFHPNKRGFDEFYGIISGARSYWANEDPNPARNLMHNYE
ncbi:MAG TPA: sulfatase-like hydrolase/transferase, partial [Pontiella sp.]